MADTRAEIARVASGVRDSGDGQGPFYNPASRTVFWSGGDADFDTDRGMTDWPELEAQLLAIDGVDHVILEAECSPEDLGLDGFTPVPYQRSPKVIDWDKQQLREMGISEHIIREVYGS